MKKVKQIKIGYSGYSKALSLLFTVKYITFLLYPLILNIILFWLGNEFIQNLNHNFENYILSILNLENASFWGASTLSCIIGSFIDIIMYILFFFVFLYVTGSVIIMILSPIFSVISEKVENDISNNKVQLPFKITQLFKDVIRGILLALRNLVIQTIIIIMVFIFSFIPVIGWFGSIYMFFVTSFFFGFSFMDFFNERHKKTVKESVKFMRKYKWTVIANGSIFALSLSLPFGIGIFLSPFVAILSIIAATISVTQLENDLE